MLYTVYYPQCSIAAIISLHISMSWTSHRVFSHGSYCNQLPTKNYISMSHWHILDLTVGGVRSFINFTSSANPQ